MPYSNHAKELEFGVLESNKALMPRLVKTGWQPWQNFSASHLPRNDLVIKANTKATPDARQQWDSLGNKAGYFILDPSHCTVKELPLLLPSHTIRLPMHFVSWEFGVRKAKECIAGTDLCS